MEHETETWNKLPLNLMDELAEKETYRRDVYRPIYSLHKWWARRPGSTFRCLGLAALTDDTITKDDILTERTTGSHDGLYIDSYDEQINPNDEHIDRDVTVLDPFAGGGTTLVEMNRLGADVVGYELNPVAWWTEKKSMDDVDLDVLEREFDRILEEMRDELGEYYTTIDPETGEECEVLYYFQSQRIPCLTCNEEEQLFPGYRLLKTKKNSPGVFYCPNSNCDDRIIRVYDRDGGLDAGTEVTLHNDETVVISDDGYEVCKACGHQFDPSDGNAGWGKYICPEGHKHDIKETLGRKDETPTFDVFAVQYVTPQGEKRIKEFGEEDERRLSEAESRYEDTKTGLPIPDQEIPAGLPQTTGALRNYNYTHFRQLLTDRHKLTFGILFQKCWEVREQEFDDADAGNVAEFLLTALSNNLNRVGKLCKWDSYTNISNDVFQRHAYIPRVQPVEANPLNSEKNIASLRNAFLKVYDAKE